MQQDADILQTLIRRLWIVLLISIIGGGLGALVSQQMPPTYQSSVYMVVVPATSNTGNNSGANGYAQAYGKLVTSPGVVGEAVRGSGVGVDPQNISKFVSVEVSPNAPVFQITARAQNPADASTIANAVSGAVSSFTDIRARDTGYRATVLVAAQAPTGPVSPNWTLNIAVGAAAGFVAGTMLALLLGNMRRVFPRVQVRWE